MESRLVLDSSLLISEFGASNDDVILDEDGDASDWIEIFNPRDEAASLAGWHVTDDVENLTKWQFPDVVVNARDHLVIFASDKNRAESDGELHTNFRISADGEFLALVEPDGTTIASQYGPEFPEQRQDISYGISAEEEVVEFVSPDSPARFVVPTSDLHSAIGRTWTGADEPFDDSDQAGWSASVASIGYDVDDPPNEIDGITSQVILEGTSGTQSFRGSLGIDFVVHERVTVTALGTFDDRSDGIRSSITTELWSRDNGSTPDDPRDDTGSSVIARQVFNASSPGELIGGSRIKELDTPLTLSPGSYSIVARGYTDLDRNGNTGNSSIDFGTPTASASLSFSGVTRFNTQQSSDFPDTVEAGTAIRYGAGLFVYTEDDSAIASSARRPDDVIAYRTRPGLGNANFNGNLGMDFQVNKPIQVTELGVFDSGQDGIEGTVGVSIWAIDGRDERQITERTFIGDAGQLEPTTGSRFIRLDEPVTLSPGFYVIVASGFLGDDQYSRNGLDNPRNGTTNTGGGAVTYLGSSRTSFAEGQDRFLELAHHRLPERRDTGPVNKWAAGTFKFTTAIDAFIGTDVERQFNTRNATLYARIPFEAPPSGAYDALRLSMQYDDGFAAYINGVKVAEENAPANLTWSSRAANIRPASGFLEHVGFDVSEHLGLLVPGETNILSIHGLNRRASDSDFLISPRLQAVTFGEPSEFFFGTPTPGFSNGPGVIGLIDTPRFDVDHGFFDSNDLNEDGQLIVGVSTDSPGAAIYYTTNGTLPNPDNGELYTQPVALSSTTTLRAAAFRDGYQPSEVYTSTYILLDDVLQQSGVPDGYASHWNGEPSDYDISQDPEDLALIAGDPPLDEDAYRELFKDSLLSLPTLSLVVDPEDLFGPTRGLYANPFVRGRISERPASVEYISADGDDGFQVDAGVRMMGWTSRIPHVSPKHSLRLVFRGDYGPRRLEFPFFDDIAVESFDTLALRSNSRDTWISDYPFGIDEFGNPTPSRPWGGMRSVATYIRDQWSKEVQRDMGRPTVAGNFVHLYLNGLYWGVYNPTERPDGAFASDHFGGEEEDYEVQTFCTAPRHDGRPPNRWNELIRAADAGLAGNADYQRILGNNPDGTRNPDFDVLIDIDNFIDFVIAGQFDAADDWPCNFYAIRQHGPSSEGFQFITWDNDLALPMFVNADGQPVADLRASRLEIDMEGSNAAFQNSPWRIEAALRENEEYMMRFADRVYQQTTDGGPLTAQANIQRWTELSDIVKPALIAESARWGDYRRDIEFAGDAELYTVNDHWERFGEHMITEFFPARTEYYLIDLKAHSLIPQFDPPTFSHPGGLIEPGLTLEINASKNVILYTLDGSDPRAIGGDINENAFVYFGKFQLDSTTQVKARALVDGQWSALSEATYVVSPPLRVTELMYNPDGAEDREFIELRNIGSRPVDLTGIQFALTPNGEGIEYTFRPTEQDRFLLPGQYVVVANNIEAFQSAYPDVPSERLADGRFVGNLSNGGETVTLRDAGGNVIQVFEYDDAWRAETDGVGRSLVIVDPSADISTWNQSDAWRSSIFPGGSPGRPDGLDGDFNGDRTVDMLDLVLLLQNLDGTSNLAWERGDADGDSDIDRHDLVLLLQNLRRSLEPIQGFEATSDSARSSGSLMSSSAKKNRGIEESIDKVFSEIEPDRNDSKR